MAIELRPGRPDDVRDLARICYEAFHRISTDHGFEPDIPAAEVAEGFLKVLLQHPGVFSVVAESDGRIVGSNFMDERSPIAGIGPITVDPGAQDSGVGRMLMQNLLDRVDEKGYPGVRLVQAAYHSRSLSLYMKLGFDARELLVTLQGPPIRQPFPGYTVRPAASGDVAACAELCTRVHGHHRSGDLRDAVGHGAALVVEYAGRITGYSTGLAFFGHTVAETNTELQALIAAAPEYGGPGFLLPARNGEVFRWCLTNGLRVVHTMTLMSRGLYNEPQGAFLPSVLY